MKQQIESTKAKRQSSGTTLELVKTKSKTSTFCNQIYTFNTKNESKGGVPCFYVYDTVNKSRIKHLIKDDTHSFAMSGLPKSAIFVQMGNPAQIFMIGGGEIDSPSAKQCRQLLELDGAYEFFPRTDMLYSRVGHSACSLGDDGIVVTGSKVPDVTNTCEYFNANTSIWLELPKLQEARYYHSSCSFNGSLVYVFCGSDPKSTNSYVSSIEMLEIGKILDEQFAQWKVVNVSPAGILTERQGLGSCQIDRNGILIFGGFSQNQKDKDSKDSKGFHKDSLYLNCTS